MSAFVMVMAAGMMLGDGPKAVSGATVETLHLSGVWKGTYRDGNGKDFRVEATDDTIHFKAEGIVFFSPRWNIIDEGEGRVRLKMEFAVPLWGIYRWEGDHLIISFCETSKRRPASFQVTEDQDLLILHRVKSGK